MRRFTVLLLFFYLAATTAIGGGYQVGLHSMRNIGMGLIGTSLSYDASSLFYNPGGASFIFTSNELPRLIPGRTFRNEHWSFSGGISFVMARATFQAQDVMYQANLNNQLSTPFYLYGLYMPNENLSLGIAINTPYGNRLAWEDDWKGRYLIQNLSFRATTIQPTVSYKFGDFIGIGVGLVYALGNVDVNKAIPLYDTTTRNYGSLNIKGNTSNIGFNAGIMVHPVRRMSIGIDYRSGIKMNVKGAEATFSVPSSLAKSFPKNKVDVSLPLPANLDFGASYDFGRFMLGMSLNFVFWNVYDSLVFNFQTKTDAVDRTAIPTLYQNRLIIRVGGQYTFKRLVTIRAGGYYDPSPVPDDYLSPMTPSTNEIGFTCGISISPAEGFSIDAAFLYLMGMERTGSYSPENFAGTYKTGFSIPGIGLTYNF